MNGEKDRKQDPGREPQLGQDSKDAKDPQKQQQTGTGERKQQQQSGTGQQYGEGSYSGTRQYNEGVKEHMQHHDIEREARDAAPRSAAEEQEMKKAERVARGKSRGEGATPDGDAADEGGSERDPNT
jgi:hypothetical protein